MSSEKQQALEETFKQFDRDDSGFIDVKELKTAIREYYNKIKETSVNEARIEKEANEIMKRCDASEDGKITKAEWFKYFE